LSPFFSLLSCRRKEVLFHRDFLVSPGSGSGCGACLPSSPFFSVSGKGFCSATMAWFRFYFRFLFFIFHFMFQLRFRFLFVFFDFMVPVPLQVPVLVLFFMIELVSASWQRRGPAQISSNEPRQIIIETNSDF
jgi:hypothetical protein